MKERPNYCYQCIYYKPTPRYNHERGRCEKLSMNVIRFEKPCDAGWKREEKKEE